MITSCQKYKKIHLSSLQTPPSPHPLVLRFACKTMPFMKRYHPPCPPWHRAVVEQRCTKKNPLQLSPLQATARRLSRAGVRTSNETLTALVRKLSFVETVVGSPEQTVFDKRFPLDQIQSFIYLYGEISPTICINCF